MGSGVEGYLEHGQVSFWLAQQAVKMDAGNPLARYTYSQALTDQAAMRKLFAKRNGLDEALSVLNPAPWHLRMGIALSRLGRFSEAENRFDAAQQFALESRPSLRFLASMRYHRRDEAGALSALQALKKVEPGFSPT